MDSKGSDVRILELFPQTPTTGPLGGLSKQKKKDLRPAPGDPDQEEGEGCGLFIMFLMDF